MTKTKFLEILEGSLNNYLRVNDLRVSQLMKMCYDIAKGMAYLEKNNVIHRYMSLTKKNLFLRNAFIL